MSTATGEITTTTTTVQALRLFVSDTNQSDATVPIRWCVSREVLADLNSRGVKRPYLFLTITHGDREVDRLLISLEQVMEYVQFHKAGTHTIRGIIVWGPNEDSFDFALCNNLLDNSRRDAYLEKIYSYSGELSLSLLRGAIWRIDRIKAGCIDAVAEIDVNVGAEYFSSEPSRLEKWWVNLWFESKPRDQCQFRRRRFVAYTIQPLIVLAWVLWMFLIRAVFAGFSLFLGMRGVKLAPLVHPFRNKTRNVYPRLDEGNYFERRNNFFLTRSDGELRSDWFTMLHPSLLMVSASVVCLMIGADVWNPNLSSGSGVAGVIAIALVFQLAITGIFILAIRGINYLESQEFSNQLYDKRSTKANLKRANDKRREELAERRRIADLEVVACDCSEAKPEVNLKALPKHKQTFYLRLQEFKSRVCRPYAR